ncbi:1,3-beta-glucan synthase component FKS1 [Sphaceloma murrayae]|uniref:1,3-beta-glucan synthase component FKS1 n=1 Tax=Sphaceloma murrayae TaxID=2082308 RepID=A0A2K1QPX1_9PEZI|nr:1,3-beta-glucan synthase component FKS1 [Sphaceloma murrayae]
MSRPNFLVIVADDLGFSDVGCFGSEIKTPNIDSLAASGLRFTDFHAAPACSPTRSMLMSGTDHHIAGVGSMAENIREFQKGNPGYEGYLNERVAPLPELLRDAGYKTYMSGKWHLGLTPGRWPKDRGFDRSFSLLPGAANHYGYEPHLLPGDKRPRLLAETNVFYVEDSTKIEPHELGPDFYSTDAFGDKMISYLSSRTEQDKSSPFFAYLAYSAPHWPLQAPDSDIAAYKDHYTSGPESLRQERLASLKRLGLIPSHATPHDVIAPNTDRLMSKPWTSLSPSERAFSSKTMQVYAAMVSHMDASIGKVLSHLRSTGELDNTFVLFMSDNGAEGLLLESIPIINENIFEHIEKYYNNSIENVGRRDSYVWYGPQWASAGTAPGRLYKGFTAEGGIRVPLVVDWKGFRGGAEGGIEHGFCTVMDVLPTVLELAGVKHPGTSWKGKEVAAVRGQSWVGYLTGQKKAMHEEETVTGWELFGRLGVRKGKWKATFIPQPYGPETWQLFDLTADPGETKDLAVERRDKLKELLEAWADYMKECGVVGNAPEYGTLVVD